MADNKSKFAEFVASKKLDTRRIVAASHKLERLMQRATDAFVAECGDDTVPCHIGPQTGTDAAKYYLDLFGRQLLDQIPN